MKALSDKDLDIMYQSFLDEVYGAVNIGSYTYDTSLALKRIDPTAYNCGYSDWLDAEITDGNLFEKDGEYFDEEPTDNDI